MTLILSWLLKSPLAYAENNDDPYLWLEGVEDEKALEWVKERNAKTVEDVAQNDDFKSLQSDLKAIYDSKDRIPYITLHPLTLQSYRSHLLVVLLGLSQSLLRTDESLFPLFSIQN